jgi:hypothetical protein
MMKYQVVRESNLTNLESSIKYFFLSEGWEPQGGVSFDGVKYIQAVVKKDKDET